MPKLFLLLFFSLHVSPVFAAIGLVAYTTGSGLGNPPQTTAFLDTTGASLIVVGVSENSGGYGYYPVISDSKGNCSGAWPLAKAYGGAVYTTELLYYCVPTTVGTGHTVTVTDPNGHISKMSVFVAAFSGVASDPLDKTSGCNYCSQPGSITPTVNGELILVVGGGDYYASAATINSGFGWLGSSSCAGSCTVAYHGALAYFVQPTAAAINPTWTQNYFSVLVMASFKPAATTGKRRIIVIGGE